MTSLTLSQGRRRRAQRRGCFGGTGTGERRRPPWRRPDSFVARTSGVGGPNPCLSAPLAAAPTAPPRRSTRSSRREGQAHRARLPQLRQLPPTAAVALRRHVQTHRPQDCEDAPHVGGVEPAIEPLPRPAESGLPDPLEGSETRCYARGRTRVGLDGSESGSWWGRARPAHQTRFSCRRWSRTRRSAGRTGRSRSPGRRTA
jgi:hypothetical protein